MICFVSFSGSWNSPSRKPPKCPPSFFWKILFPLIPCAPFLELPWHIRLPDRPSNSPFCDFLPLSISDLLSMNFPQLDLPVASCIALISQCFPASLNMLFLKENILFFQECNSAPATLTVINFTQTKLSSPPRIILCLPRRSSLVFSYFVVFLLQYRLGCLPSVVVINTMTEATGRGNGLFQLTSYSPSLRQVRARTQGRKGLEAGPAAETLQESCSLTYSRLLPSYFSYPAQTHLSRDGTAHRSLGSPPSISNQENSNLMETILQPSFSLPRCVRLIT